ncbi:MAG: SDR family oxidoreductase [Flavobacteriaceae bacterium]|nr:SDR family oxidoreductase [Flavobacteriaceae bacterium]
MIYTAVITGASRGIGYAVAKRFAEAGFSLFLVSRNTGDLENAKRDLLQAGAPSVYIYSADLSDESQTQSAIEAIKAQFSHITVLVNSTGMFMPGTMMEESNVQFQQLWNTNVSSAYWVSKGLWPVLKVSSRAHVFTLCSVASLMAYSAGGTYSLSKFALLGFSKSLRLEGMPYGIAVSAVILGATYTDSWAGINLPESRFMKSTDIATAIYAAFEINESAVMEEVLIRPLLGDI